MRKYFILALLLAFITTGVFALDVGGGLMFGIGSREEYDHHNDYSYRDKIEYTMVDFGLTGFIGWKYFDFTLGLSFKTTSGGVSYSYTVFHTGFDIKIPITISSNIRIYPMIGLDMALVFGADVFPITGALHGGMGVDVLLFRNMFLRGNILYDYYTADIYDSRGGGILIRACAGWRF